MFSKVNNFSSAKRGNLIHCRTILKFSEITSLGSVAKP